MSDKSKIRKQFRKSVFKRDGYRCKCCGVAGKDRQDDELNKTLVDLDAHHIINRNELPNGGYVKENGITVCTECHFKCESYWECGVSIPGFSPEDLFKLIGSSREEATEKSLKCWSC